MTKLFITSLLALSGLLFTSFSQIVPLPGSIFRFYYGKEGKCAVLTRDSSKIVVTVFDKKDGQATNFSVPANAQFLDNSGFASGMVFLVPRAKVDTVTKIQGNLKWLSLKTGEVLDMKTPVWNNREGAWMPPATEGDQFLYNGKLFSIENGKVVYQKVSGVPHASVSADLKKCAQFLIQPGYDGKERASIVVEDLKTGNILNAETFLWASENQPTVKFSLDSKYIFYSANGMPAVYEMKSNRSTPVPSMEYRPLGASGAFLDGEDYILFHDPRMIVFVGKKSLEIEHEIPNPFGFSTIEIMGLEDDVVTGAIYEKRGELKVFTRLFKVKLTSDKESQTECWDLPMNALVVSVQSKHMAGLQLENGSVKSFEMKMLKGQPL